MINNYKDSDNTNSQQKWSFMLNKSERTIDGYQYKQENTKAAMLPTVSPSKVWYNFSLNVNK